MTEETPAREGDWPEPRPPERERGETLDDDNTPGTAPPDEPDDDPEDG